ncbi:MAG: type II toxin-antitoxin system HicB family antitoxin [Pasteurellaceae bacterium]|nr:type II toxin-antitoxin system HicB family antitoxin [Pasteurellaceae bacterium]
MKFLHHKGYVGTIEADLANNMLFGKLAYMRDLVTYEAPTLAELKHEFEQSIELYLQDCAELGKTPDKPFKGTFNVRISEELHREATLLAGNRSLNTFVYEAIQEKVDKERVSLAP